MRYLVALFFSFSLFSPFVISAEQQKAPTPAQEMQRMRMVDCNKEASQKALKGDERKAFMSHCLKGESQASSQATMTQQEKMKFCNAEANKQSLKGDARKQFMSTCLKKPK